MTETLSEDGRRLRAAIKRILKNRGYQYSDLAGALGVSTATVKRFLTRDDLTFERLVKIADWLNVSLHELMDASSSWRPGAESFTESQEVELAKDSRAFLYFHLLFVGRGRQAVVEEFAFPRKEEVRIQRLLERIGVVEVWPGDRIRFKVRGPLKLRSGGPLERAYFAKAVDTIYRRIRGQVRGYANRGSSESAVFFRPFEMPLMPETYGEFTREMAALVDRYRALGMLQVTFEPAAKLQHVAGMVMADFYYFWPDALK